MLATSSCVVAGGWVCAQPRSRSQPHRTCIFQQSKHCPQRPCKQHTKLDRFARESSRLVRPATLTAAVTNNALPALPELSATYEETCAFSDFANWIIPDQVLLGRYPFVEPSRCRSHAQGEEQLKTIIQAGITTFVSLQEEVPSQDQMPIGGVDGFYPYRATAQLIASSMSDPPCLEEISQLRTRELNKFLPPSRKAPVNPGRVVLELSFLQSPIVDISIPSEQQLATLLDELVARINKGEKLYIHCWGGRGRAGTVGAALLAKVYGVSADEALERVQRSFDTRKDGGRKSPETQEQVGFVRNFIASH